MLVIPLQILFEHKDGEDIIYTPLSRRWGIPEMWKTDWEYEETTAVDTDIEPVDIKAYRRVKRIAKKQVESTTKWKEKTIKYHYALIHPPFVDIDYRFVHFRGDDEMLWKRPFIYMTQIDLFSDRDYRFINDRWLHVLDWDMQPDSGDMGRRVPWNRWCRPMPPNSRLLRGYIEFAYALDGETFCQQIVRFEFDYDADKYTTRTGWKTYHYGRGRGIGIHPVRIVENAPSPQTLGIGPYKTGRYEETVEKQNRLLSWIFQ